MVVHLTTATVLAGLQRVRQKEKEVEESIIKGFEKLAKQDQMKQKIKIQKKIQMGEPLNEFEKWFVQQPIYYELPSVM
jgi:hypothetical protein